MEGIRNPRRISATKESRLALLSRMREAKEKGERLIIEKEEGAVYDTVDEAEYAKLVQQRLEDDWIVDDEGDGYADDGREIFDDHDEDQELAERKPKEKRATKSQPSSKKLRMNPDIRANDSVPLRPAVGRDIRSLFAATSAQNITKKRKEPLDSVVDPNLDDLLAELETSVPEVPTSRKIDESSNRIRKVKSRKTAPSSWLGSEELVLPASEKRLDQHLNRRQQPTKHHRTCDSGTPVRSHSPDHESSGATVPTPRTKNPFSVESRVKSTMSAEQKSTKRPKRNEVTTRSHDASSDEDPGQLSTVEIADETKVTAMDFEDEFEEPDELFSISDQNESRQQARQTRSPSLSAPLAIETRVTEAKPILPASWLVAEAQAIQEPTTKWEDDSEATTTPLFASSVDGTTVHFYWFDAYEDIRLQPGVVYLFGKARNPNQPGKFNSCCVRIKDLERRIFLLPRNDYSDIESGPTMKDVYAEFREISAEHKIPKFRCKQSTKRYAFEYADVPVEADYLEVRYAANYPALPSDLQGKTFSHVFGTNTSFLENFILELQLRGPCWLELKNCVTLQPQVSWCQVDYEISWKSGSNCPVTKLSTILERESNSSTDNKPVRLPPAPPLCLVAINIKSVTQAHANHSEIISIGLLIDQNYSLDRPANHSLFQSHYLVLAPPKDAALPYDLRNKLLSFGAQYAPPAATWLTNPSNGSDDVKVTLTGGGVDIEPNERALLGRFLTRLHRLDPDVIVGHDLWGHQIELLVQRLHSNKVAHWHRIGRLRRSAQFAINTNSRAWLIRNSMPGRLVCDTRVSARELVRSRTYNLSDLAHQILGDIPSGGTVGSTSARRQVPIPIRQRLCGNTAAATNGDALVEMGVELADLEIDSADLRCLFATSDLLRQLIDFCLSDAHLVLRLAYQLQILPLAMQITSICGNVLSRTLSGGRAERNEALLLHAFTQRGYIVPDPVVMRRAGGGRGAQPDEWDAHMDQADVDGKPITATSAGRRKPAYTGGLVLEPKKGFYDKYILLLDFNSLYPSIIQEFNICFTTVDRELVTGSKSGTGAGEPRSEEEQSAEPSDLDSIVAALLATIQGSNAGNTATGADPLDRKLRLPTTQTPGLLPVEIRRLVESRREVKKLISAASAGSAPTDPAQLAQWNTRQAALKLTANSVYGCLGFNASRFCARGLAALVTGLGRAVLMNTRDLVENMNLEVIYGDTDSIMVNTNTTDLLAALTIGEKVRQEVNKHYRLLELDTDGVYAAMLLLAKKKYAALAIVNPIQWAQIYRANQAQSAQKLAPQALTTPPATKQEMKGLDIVRRDWSALAVAVGKRCVAALLSGDPKDVILDRIHADLMDTAERVRSGQLPISDFIITKMLTKAPEEYADSKSLPHVQVALRLNSGSSVDASGSETTQPTAGVNRRLRAGDTVEYVICCDGSTQVATQRGYSPTELSNSRNNLTIDVNYYLAHQIHPVVSRLVAPIEGTSPARIADCLGLDPSGYRRQTGGSGGVDDDGDENGDLALVSSGSSGFAGPAAWGDVDPLTVDCPRKCGGPQISIKSSAFGLGSKSWVCPNCSFNLLQSVDAMRCISNRLTIQARKLIIRYELGWLACEDPACGMITRAVYCPPSSVSGGGAHGDSDGLWARGGRPLCPGCGGQAMLKARYSESRLYRQLCYFRYLVSPPTAGAETEGFINPSILRCLQQCRTHLDRILSHSAFAMVDLQQLFSGLRSVHTGPGTR